MAVAERLLASEISHLERTAEIIKGGGIAAVPFNGIFGLFGDIGNIEAAEAIIRAKNRPKNKNLIAVFRPEQLGEYVDSNRLLYPPEGIIALWRDIHALGIILPASSRAPSHLVVNADQEPTILTIWTEYTPLRLMIERLHELGIWGLVGTSANKSDQPTHWRFSRLWEDFKYDVQVVVEADFSSLPKKRRKSTSIIDLTNHQPRFHRAGNVGKGEIRAALKKHGFPKLLVPRDIIVVRGRN